MGIQHHHGTCLPLLAYSAFFMLYITTGVHEIHVCHLMLFIRSCSSDDESKAMSRLCAHQNDTRGTLRGAIPSCIVHAAFHCRLSVPMLHRCCYVLVACTTVSTTPHCIASCMCMHRLSMCISGRCERGGRALRLKSDVTP